MVTRDETTAAAVETVHPGSTGQRVLLVLVLGSLSVIGPLSIDMYLPGLPAIQRDLDTSASLVQLTLSACLLGLALGQLVAGPISDVVGRRPPVLVGIGGFVVASALCVVAPDVETLVACRFLQGLFGSAGMVIPRAVVRDLFSGVQAAQFFSLLMLVIGAGPILAPTLGGGILLVTDWRGIFGALVAIGLVLLMVAWRFLPETSRPEHRNRAGVGPILGAFRTLLRDRVFVGYALMIGMSMGTMFAYIAGSSFILQNRYGVSEQRYAILFGLIAVGYIGMSQVNARLISRVPMRRMLAVGVGANLAGALTILLMVNALDLGATGFVAGLLLVAVSNGLINPNVTALAMNGYPRLAGSASALLGVTSFAVGALVAPLVGVAGEDTAVPLSLVMAGLSLCGLAAFLGLTARRSGGQ